MALITECLKHFIKIGKLHIWEVNKNQPITLSGALNGPEVGVRFHTKTIQWRLWLTPELALGEGYMNGEISLVKGTIYDLLNLCTLNIKQNAFNPPGLGEYHNKFSFLFRSLYQANSLGKARRHIAHHYELGAEFYKLFLDSSLQYSCAYFKNEEEELETAQENKKRHIAAKLRLEPGQHVLDLGCGWGGLVLFLAQHKGVYVTGLTLSEDQFEFATQRASEMGLAHQVKFYLRDYRKEEGQYDRIVSVGMFEHVGVSYYPIFFNKIKQLLKEDGVALLHTIGRSQGPGNTNAWIKKYIFPGGIALLCQRF